MADQARLLWIGSSSPLEALLPSGNGYDVVRAPDWSTGLDQLDHEQFRGLVANLSEPGVTDALRALQQAGHILAQVADGIAVVDFDLRIRWANPTFHHWCAGNPLGRGFYEALGSHADQEPEFCPFQSAQACRSTATPDERSVCITTRLECRERRVIDFHITPLRDGPTGPMFIALGLDATRLVQKQRKLDALHQAGHDLAALDPEQLAELSIADRTELLKSNIRRLTRDLLHYEVIEIRLLDPETKRLVPLLQDGMTPDAAGRDLLAHAEGNGVTGFVAATGKSYLCQDTAADPLYLPGAPGARSSLTVPLRLPHRIIGTFNVESPRAGAFGEEDLQFTEIFSHAVAAALHTLDLLSAEKTSGASQSIEAVNREVALPVDDILADATTLLERYVGHSPEVGSRIHKILANARLIKQSIVKVGEEVGSRPLSAIRESVPAVLKGMRVLVADNDDRVRRSAHQLIGRWGGIVETARDGKEALTMARLGRYDAIVADIRLPDLSGYEVYSGLRAAQPAANVILMTGFGYDPGHSIVKARQDGLRHILYKPFRVDQLRDALTSVRKDRG